MRQGSVKERRLPIERGRNARLMASPFTNSEWSLSYGKNQNNELFGLGREKRPAREKVAATRKRKLCRRHICVRVRDPPANATQGLKQRLVERLVNRVAKSVQMGT